MSECKRSWYRPPYGKRLGVEPTHGLLELLDTARDEWSAPMLTKETFEPRREWTSSGGRSCFWVGQVVAIASILGFMLRFVAPAR